MAWYGKFKATQAMLKEEQQDHCRRPLPDDIKFIAGLPATYNQEKEVDHAHT